MYHVITILMFVAMSLAGTRALWAASGAVASVGSALRERAGWPASASRLVVIAGLTLTVASSQVELLLEGCVRLRVLRTDVLQVPVQLHLTKPRSESGFRGTP